MFPRFVSIMAVDSRLVNCKDQIRHGPCFSSESPILSINLFAHGGRHVFEGKPIASPKVTSVNGSYLLRNVVSIVLFNHVERDNRDPKS